MTQSSTYTASFNYISPKFYPEDNFTGNLIVLTSIPYGDFTSSPVTIKSISIPSYTYVTLYPSASYTGTQQTYNNNTLSISTNNTFSSYIIQNSLVPYINENLIPKITDVVTLYPDILLGGTQITTVPVGTTTGDYAVKSIKIPEGLVVKVTDKNNNTMTFYHDVLFLGAFLTSSNAAIGNIVTVEVSLAFKCPECKECEKCTECKKCECDYTTEDNITQFSMAPDFYIFFSMVILFIILLTLYYKFYEKIDSKAKSVLSKVFK